MDQNDELASLKESIRIFERLTAAARLAAVYSDKKKILRYVYKTLKFERKQFGRSCYPLTDGYSGTILLMFSEFAETLEKLPASRLPDFILALHFDSRYDYRKDFQPEIPVLDVDISICNDFKKEHYNFSHEYLCEMLEAGERYGEELCKELFTGDVSREGLQKKADEIFLREHGERQRHISVDRLFSMLNTIGKLLRRDAANIKKLY